MSAVVGLAHQPAQKPATRAAFYMGHSGDPSTTPKLMNGSGSYMNHGQEIAGGTSRFVFPQSSFARTEPESQFQLPEGAVPVCMQIYADNTKLSSFGTQAGYPVIVQCLNLPSHIRNGTGLVQDGPIVCMSSITSINCIASR